MTRTRFKMMILAAVLTAAVMWLAGASTAHAQEAAASSGAQTTTLWGMFRLGGWSMYVLLLGSICAVGLTIYNGMTLQTKKFLRVDLYEQIKEHLAAADFAAVTTLCDSEKAPISNIIHAGLDRVAGSEFDIESVEKGMEEAATEEVTGNLTPINYLSVIAVIAPMVGLLGTVSGMIKAFGNMASAGMGKPEVLANNISEALITTASGLIVGIPVMIIYFYFKNRYTGLISALNRMAGELLEKMKQAAKAGDFHMTHHGVESGQETT